ncbi:CBS domain-containing protein [Antarcticirhabdus aurantiaca]|uniref:CBS domain-containing protein n=1 Tax=Antarcticirhabdus aurantiaca TaxID=2606717 RepID=A0ACD4NRF2_9HYPH|nr:CBS domain-containing protein [Antarcticirhabdus aurantiaca]WAJ29511.1 CBS domain-containing protein [Jeongeuplla avenae]
MTVPVITVSPLNGVKQAARLMLDRSISGLPVIDDDGSLVGIVTEGDLLRRVELGIGTLATADDPTSPEERARAYVRSHGWKVSDVMSSPAVTVAPDDTLAEVAATLHRRRIKRVPVTRDGRIVGIVSRADLLRAVAIAKPEPVAAGDGALRRAIVTRLRDDAGVDPSNLAIEVEGGEVRIRGCVGSSVELEAVRTVAEAIPGVSGVTIDLSVPTD